MRVTQPSGADRAQFSNLSCLPRVILSVPARIPGKIDFLPRLPPFPALMRKGDLCQGRDIDTISLRCASPKPGTIRTLRFV